MKKEEFEEWVRSVHCGLTDLMFRENDEDTLVGWAKEFAVLLVQSAKDESDEEDL